MSKPQIGCDIDLVCCPSDINWRKWLCSECSAEDYEHYVYLCHTKDKLPYDLGKIFTSVENPMRYWHDLDYFQFEPIQGSVEALKELSEYFDIVFISHVEGGDHGRSKCKWIKHHFPFYTGICYTRQKFTYNKAVEFHIDDRKSHLVGFDHHKRILFETKYDQKGFEDIYIHKSFSNWKELDIKQLIEEYL